MNGMAILENRIEIRRQWAKMWLKAPIHLKFWYVSSEEMSSVAITVRNFLDVHPWGRAREYSRTHVGTARAWTALSDQGYCLQTKAD